MTLLTTAPVRQPRARRSVAIVGTSGSTRSALASTPIASGCRPVISALTEASVNGAAAYAVAKRTPVVASRSRFGVSPSALP